MLSRTRVRIVAHYDNLLARLIGRRGRMVLINLPLDARSHIELPEGHLLIHGCSLVGRWYPGKPGPKSKKCLIKLGDVGIGVG